jgi:hypothetical protein
LIWPVGRNPEFCCSPIIEWVRRKQSAISRQQDIDLNQLLLTADR